MYLSICPLVLHDHVSTLVRVPQTNMLNRVFTTSWFITPGWDALHPYVPGWDALHPYVPTMDALHPDVLASGCITLGVGAFYLYSIHLTIPLVLSDVQEGYRLARRTLSKGWGVTKPRASSTPPVSLVNGIKKTRTHVKKPRPTRSPAATARPRRYDS